MTSWRRLRRSASPPDSSAASRRNAQARPASPSASLVRSSARVVAGCLPAAGRLRRGLATALLGLPLLLGLAAPAAAQTIDSTEITEGETKTFTVSGVPASFGSQRPSLITTGGTGNVALLCTPAASRNSQWPNWDVCVAGNNFNSNTRVFTVRLQARAEDSDNRDETVAFRIQAQGTGASGSFSFTITVKEPAPVFNESVTVLLSAQEERDNGTPGDTSDDYILNVDESTVKEDGSDAAAIAVGLSTNLAAGRTLTVPLTVTGAGILASDYTIALDSNAANTGVTLDTSNPHSAAQPAVVFTGHDTNTVRFAKLLVRGAQDTVNEGTETLHLSLGTITGNLSSIGKNSRRHSTRVKILDDEITASLWGDDTIAVEGDNNRNAYLEVRLNNPVPSGQALLVSYSLDLNATVQLDGAQARRSVANNRGNETAGAVNFSGPLSGKPTARLRITPQNHTVNGNSGGIRVSNFKLGNVSGITGAAASAEANAKGMKVFTLDRTASLAHNNNAKLVSMQVSGGDAHGSLTVDEGGSKVLSIGRDTGSLTLGVQNLSTDFGDLGRLRAENPYADVAYSHRDGDTDYYRVYVHRRYPGTLRLPVNADGVAEGAERFRVFIAGTPPNLGVEGEHNSLMKAPSLDFTIRPSAAGGRRAPATDATVEAPDTPVANVRATAVDAESATVAWDAVPRATSYWVEYEGETGSGSSFQYISGAYPNVAGTSLTLDHSAPAAMTLTITVTPAYEDSQGSTVLLGDLASSTTLDVDPDTDGGSDPVDRLGGGTDGGGASACVSAELIADVQAQIDRPGASDAHVARWTKVKKALNGEDTAAVLEEAREVRERRQANGLSVTQWDPVIEALECLEQESAPEQETDTEQETETESETAPTPEVTISGGGTITEGSRASFTVTANPAPSSPLGVSLTVSQSGDFTADTGPKTVTVPTGGSVSFNIGTSNDPTDEPDGSISVTVNAGSGYTVGGASTHTVNVTDDDDPPDPEVTISGGGAVTEGNPASFTVTASPAPSSPLDVTVSVAQSGDFGATSGSRTVTVPTGGSVSFTIGTEDDATDEPDGSISVTVSAGSGYTVGRASTHTVGVADNDEAPVAACVSDALLADVQAQIDQSGASEAHVARWTKVMKALKQESGGITLEEVRAIYDNRQQNGWSTDQWAPVLEALECLEEQEAGATAHAPLVPNASDALREGVVWISNPTAQDTSVEIVAVDDAGWRRDPVMLDLDAGASAAFTSRDLEWGNPSRGLDEGVGPGIGDWRLEITSDAGIEVMPYVRASDGYLATMGDTAPEKDNVHQVSLFHPAGGYDPVGRLRLTNRGDQALTATITGIDDTGASPGGAVTVTVPAYASVQLGALDLEGGAPGIGGQLGDGEGNWRLRIRSDGELAAMSLIESLDGRLANLSDTAADTPGAGDLHRVALFPSGADPSGRQGLVRIVNSSARDGLVRIEPTDGIGQRYAPLRLTLGAGEAANLSTWDLELGNAAKGLSGYAGPGTGGDWRLDISSQLDIEVGAYTLTDTGFIEPARAEGAARVKEDASR